MAGKISDPTTKTANTLASIALFLAVAGGAGFVFGFSLLAVGEGGSGISMLVFFGGGFCLTTGLLMMTVQSSAMLIIRELWTIERGREKS